MCLSTDCDHPKRQSQTFATTYKEENQTFNETSFVQSPERDSTSVSSCSPEDNARPQIGPKYTKQPNSHIYDAGGIRFNLSKSERSDLDLEMHDNEIQLLIELLQNEKSCSKLTNSNMKRAPVMSMDDTRNEFDPIRLCPSHTGLQRPAPKRFYLFWWRGIISAIYNAARKGRMHHDLADMHGIETP